MRSILRQVRSTCRRCRFRCFEADSSLPADTSDSEPVVVIDSVLAHTYFPHKDPVGQLITVAHWRTARVIGVVGHVRHWGLGDTGTYNPSQIYISFYQLPDEWVPTFARDLSLAVRTPLDVASHHACDQECGLRNRQGPAGI